MKRPKLLEAVQMLENGGVVAHATEGVWGLACDPWNEQSVLRLLKIKRREMEKGLIVIGAFAMQFAKELNALPPNLANEVKDSWPGHTTWVLPTCRFPNWVTGGRNTIAVRVPAHEQARSLCEAFGGPLVSTSANVSDQRPARTESDVRSNLGDCIDMILPGKIGDATGPSAIRDVVRGEIIR